MVVGLTSFNPVDLKPNEGAEKGDEHQQHKPQD